MIISLNEACRHQANYVVQQLWLSSFNVDMQFVDSAGGNFYCEDSGNAIIAVNVGSVWDKTAFYFTDDGLITSEKTERSAACLLGSYLATLDRFVRMCSVHLG